MSLTLERVNDSIEEAISHIFGARAATEHSRAIRIAAQLVTTSFCDAGLESCLCCGELTSDLWLEVAFCQRCQDANPAIVAIKLYTPPKDTTL